MSGGSPSLTRTPSPGSSSRSYLPAVPSQWNALQVSQYIEECGFPNEAKLFHEQVPRYLTDCCCVIFSRAKFSTTNCSLHIMLIPQYENGRVSAPVSYTRMVFIPIYLFQDIDGKSLMLLLRQDVISNMSLKLGPALKIYEKIKMIQKAPVVKSKY